MMEIASGRSVSLQSGHQPQFLTGLDANKSGTPGIGDTYYATDTKKTYICYVAGTWYNNNVLRGVLGVASGWDTAPTNLANCTDGDVDTVTGTGSKVMAAAGYFGELLFDLGSSKTLLIGSLTGIWATTGAMQIYVMSSEDNITYTAGDSPLVSTVAAAEAKAWNLTKILKGRYIKLAFRVSVASTGYAKIYEVVAYELRI